MAGWEASIGLASRVSGKPAINGSGQRVCRPEADCSKDLHYANTSLVCALDCFPGDCEFKRCSDARGRAMWTQDMPCGSLVRSMPAFSSQSVDFGASPMRAPNKYRLWAMPVLFSELLQINAHVFALSSRVVFSARAQLCRRGSCHGW